MQCEEVPCPARSGGGNEQNLNQTNWNLFDTKVMSMKAEILSAADVRGYAERTGTPEIPESVRKKRLDDLMDEELVQL